VVPSMVPVHDDYNLYREYYNFFFLINRTPVKTIYDLW
jgi:hypothetical protein